MAGRGARAAGVVILLLASTLPFSDGAATFGALSVTAPSWLLVVPPSTSDFRGSTLVMNYSEGLFQSPGDLNSDGFDDLIGWTFGPVSGGQFVGWGQANGTFLEEACPVRCRAPFGIPEWQEYRPAGGGPALDQAPIHLDADLDGSDDWLAWVGPLWSCSPPGPCPEDLYQVIFQTPLNYSISDPNATPTSITIPGRFEGDPVAFAYLTPPLRPGDGAAVIVEKPHYERSNNGTAPAFTQVQAFYLKGRALAGGSEPWTFVEASPLAAQPRPPRFVAAPDFDRDGLGDLVFWSPPAPSPTGGPSPAAVTIVNGTPAGPDPARALMFRLDLPQVLFGDFDGDGHPDLASYGFVPAQPGVSTSPSILVNFQFWNPAGLAARPSDSIRLQGPSIFASQPLPKLQVGDVDGDGRPDFVSAKYDTTSASSGHLLVDAFINALPCRGCDYDPFFDPSYSSEITLSGPDIYTNDAGVRLNVASDYDGDGRADITVGYYGGNAPERGRTSSSGFVAVLFARTVMGAVYGVTIDYDAGGLVYPIARAYSLTVSGTIPENGTAHFEFEGLNSPLGFDVDLASGNLSSPFVRNATAQGPISLLETAIICRECRELVVRIAFYWNFSDLAPFGVTVTFLPGDGGPERPLAHNPRLATFERRVTLSGTLRTEWNGRDLGPGDWVPAAAVVNVSGLFLAFVGPAGVFVPRQSFTWAVRVEGAVGATAPGDPLMASVLGPTRTVRGAPCRVEVTGLPDFVAAPTLNFTLNADANPPQFGAHLPLESEWVTSTPTFVAVDIFDNESGVDPDRIEYSWENDGAPFIRWDRAAALPGQTAAEVVGQALILFPEGNLSDVIWRVWDRVGNGPAQSPIFGVKVDTTGITFRNPRPPASEWQNTQSVVANVEILSGSSGVYRDSVEYRVSTGGLFDFGPWITAPTLSSPLDPTFVATTALVLEEGDANWVQWRADSNARVGLRLSDPFQIRVDSLRPIIVTVQPNETSIFPYGPVPLSLSAHEGSPAGVAQRGLDTSASGATFRIKGPADPDFGRLWPLPLTNSSPDGWSASFANSAGFERGNSTVEFTVRENGGRTVTALTTVRVNRPPTVTVESTPANFTVAVLANLTLNATALDPEGQPLRYLWTTCAPPPVPSPRPVPPPPPLSRNASVTLSADAPEALRTDTARAVNLCLVVRDSMDGETRINVTVYVVVPPPPEPPLPPPTTPQVTVPTADAGLAAVVLVIAAAVAALALLLRRRRAPPDNV